MCACKLDCKNERSFTSFSINLHSTVFLGRPEGGMTIQLYFVFREGNGGGREEGYLKFVSVFRFFIITQSCLLLFKPSPTSMQWTNELIRGILGALVTNKSYYYLFYVEIFFYFI